MKLKDIKVGEEYAIGTDRWNKKGVVLEVGEITRPRAGWPRAGLTEVVKGAKVQYPDALNHQVSEEVVRPAAVLRPWTEQVAWEEAERKRREAANRAQAERAAAAAALATDFERATGETVHIYAGEAKMSERVLRRVLNLLVEGGRHG